MTEAELLKEVSGICDRLGLFVHHCPHAELCQGDIGFPDLVIAGPNGVLFAELKSQSGKLAPAQRDWARILGGRHLDGRSHAWAQWRPEHLWKGEIEITLLALRQPVIS